MTRFRTERLDNGVVLEFFDRSNRYFGDYHRVCVEVRLYVSIPDRAEPPDKVFTLERMGVAGAEVETTRNHLVEDYWRNAARYLGHATYPAKLIAASAAPRRRLHPAGCRDDAS
ncbi:MAG: hypothetical protein FIB02_00130 [Desulfuromonas sp.]|nr:hypothetical protein [Desulfuromonas sp.]